MQLGTSTIPLLPAVGVGVAVVLAGLVVWGVLRARTTTGAPTRGARRDRVEESDPGDRDWTGEIAGGAADPPAPPRPLTVAEAVAARRADTAPMAAVRTAPEPGSADDTPAAWALRHGGEGPGGVAGGPAGPPTSGPDVPGPVGSVPGEGRSPVEGADRTAAAASTAAGPSGIAAVGAADEGPGVDHSPGAPTPETDPGDPAESTPLVPGGAPDEPPAGVVPDLAEDIDGLDAVDVVDAAATGPVPPPWSPARTAPGAGPSEPVSVAVQQALAARAVQRARTRPDEPDDATDDDPAPVADARDRLLSVLLTDPTTAVGATGELDDARARIDRLGDVLRRRRAELSSAVQRLHRSGLTGEQIGQLAGLDGDDVRTILEQPSGEGGGGR